MDSYVGATAPARRQPGDELLAADSVDVDGEAALRGLRTDGVKRREQALAKHPELKSVEDAVNLLAVPPGALKVGKSRANVEVTHQPVEPLVAQHEVEVITQ